MKSLKRVPVARSLPPQLLNAYLGSTFRTIEEIFHESSSSNAALGAAVMAAQVAVAVGVTVRECWD